MVRTKVSNYQRVYVHSTGKVGLSYEDHLPYNGDLGGVKITISEASKLTSSNQGNPNNQNTLRTILYDYIYSMYLYNFICI